MTRQFIYFVLAEDIRDFCIKYNLFTCGNGVQYDNLILKYKGYHSIKDARDMCLIIKYHSNTDYTAADLIGFFLAEFVEVVKQD